MKTNLTLALALLAAVGLAGCNTTPTQDGAVVGGALGAGLGAIIGNQSGGRSGEGALIGAGVGALTGALVGDHVDDQRQGVRRTHVVQQQPAQPVVVQQQPADPPPHPGAVERGHYVTRIVETPSGERYEERVWVRED